MEQPPKRSIFRMISKKAEKNTINTINTIYMSETNKQVHIN